MISKWLIYGGTAVTGAGLLIPILGSATTAFRRTSHQHPPEGADHYMQEKRSLVSGCSLARCHSRYILKEVLFGIKEWNLSPFPGIAYLVPIAWGLGGEVRWKYALGLAGFIFVGLSSIGFLQGFVSSVSNIIRENDWYAMGMRELCGQNSAVAEF